MVEVGVVEVLGGFFYCGVDVGKGGDGVEVDNWI